MNQKTIILTVGGKGGTGKTTALSAIADYLLISGAKVALYDGDPKNSGPGSFYSAYQRIAAGPPILLDPSSDSKADSLDRPVIDLLKGDLEFALIDLGAGDDMYLIPWVLDNASVLAEENITLCVLASITKMSSSVFSFLSVLEELKSNATYLLGLNAGFCSDFTFFTKSMEYKEANKHYEVHPFIVIDRGSVGRFFDQLGDSPALIVHPNLAVGECPHNFYERPEILNLQRVRVILSRQQDEIDKNLGHLLGCVAVH